MSNISLVQLSNILFVISMIGVFLTMLGYAIYSIKHYVNFIRFVCVTMSWLIILISSGVIGTIGSIQQRHILTIKITKINQQLADNRKQCRTLIDQMQRHTKNSQQYRHFQSQYYANLDTKQDLQTKRNHFKHQLTKQ